MTKAVWALLSQSRRCGGFIAAGIIAASLTCLSGSSVYGQQPASIQLPHASCLAIMAAKLDGPIVFELLNNKIPKVSDPEHSEDLLERIYDGRAPLGNAIRSPCGLQGLNLGQLRKINGAIPGLRARIKKMADDNKKSQTETDALIKTMTDENNRIIKDAAILPRMRRALIDEANKCRLNTCLDHPEIVAKIRDIDAKMEENNKTTIANGQKLVNAKEKQGQLKKDGETIAGLNRELGDFVPQLDAQIKQASPRAK